VTRRAAGRLAAAVLGAAVLVGLATTPAAADPPRPTNYRSTVTAVDPELPAGAEVRIIGGDSLIELTIPSGHTALVPDYPTSGDDGPAVPYLRFDADGTVQRNALAVATTANDSRYGTASDVPDPDAEPAWETVATDGTYAWHDHRIHWMSPTAPRAVDADGRVDLGGPDGSWTVPIVVDGRATAVTGTLRLEPPPSPWAWGLVGLVGAAATVLVGLRWGQRPAAGIAAAAGLAATTVSWATWEAVPPGAGATFVPVVVAATAGLAGLAGAVVPHRFRLVALAAASAALVGWGATRATVLTRAILPTSAAPAWDRGVTAAAIGVGLGVACLLLRRPAADGAAAPASSRPLGATASPSA
jgi:hypothetical protein